MAIPGYLNWKGDRHDVQSHRGKCNRDLCTSHALFYVLFDVGSPLCGRERVYSHRFARICMLETACLYSECRYMCVTHL